MRRRRYRGWPRQCSLNSPSIALSSAGLIRRESGNHHRMRPGPSSFSIQNARKRCSLGNLETGRSSARQRSVATTDDPADGGEDLRSRQPITADVAVRSLSTPIVPQACPSPSRFQFVALPDTTSAKFKMVPLLNELAVPEDRTAERPTKASPLGAGGQPRLSAKD